MQKKHTFSPNHKVVTDSKHNFHPHGNPSTASMGQAPQSIGGGGGEQPGGDSDGASGGMDGMNFCDGGMKYADGGNVFDRAGEAVSRVADKLTNSAAQQYSDNAAHQTAVDHPPLSNGINQHKAPDGTYKSPAQIADEES